MSWVNLLARWQHLGLNILNILAGVETRDLGSLSEYQKMLPPSISALTACVRKSAQSVPKSACCRSAHVRLGVLPGVLSKPCTEAWLTSQHSSRSWRSRRHFQDLDFTYQHSGRVSGPSPRGICTVTCCRKALCALGADYYVCRSLRGGSSQTLFSNVEVFHVLNIPKWQFHPLNISLGKCKLHV